jgi:hypothetical protein
VVGGFLGGELMDSVASSSVESRSSLDICWESACLVCQLCCAFVTKAFVYIYLLS